MKTAFLVSVLACAALAAPGLNKYHHVSAETKSSEIQENKSPAFEESYLELREANETTDEHLIQSNETGNQGNVDKSIHMAKAASNNLEKNLNNIEEPEQSANAETAKQALEDGRKILRELQEKRLASLMADQAARVTSSELKKSDTESMSHWKGQKESVLRNEEGLPELSGHKLKEMEESASNNKESFRAPDALNDMANHHLQKDSVQGLISKSNKVQLKTAENVEKVKQPTMNRNSESLTNDVPEIKKIQNINIQKKMQLHEHPRASTQFLEVPEQPKHKNLKQHLSDEPSQVLLINNTNKKNRELSIKSAEHIDSKWSSTKNNEQVVKGKSAEFEDTGDSAQDRHQLVVDHVRASQADLPWRPPGSKLHQHQDSSKQNRELLSENMQWENLPQSDMRSAYGAAYGIGGAGNAGIISGAGAERGGASAIGIFPNAQVSNCAIPLLLSCSPSVVSGSLGKSYSSSYGSFAGAYRSNSDKANQPSKRNAKNLNSIELSKTKRTASKNYPQYRVVPNNY